MNLFVTCLIIFGVIYLEFLGTLCVKCKSQYKNVGLGQYKNVGFPTSLYCLF